MIIRRLFKKGTTFNRTLTVPSLRLAFNCATNQNAPTQTSISNKQLLDQVLKQVGLLKQPSIFMSETQDIENRKKHTLSKQDKLKLGLYIPKMTLNPRMGVESQLSYRQTICEHLYELQQSHLPTKVRILQKQTRSEHLTMDNYINSVYKDIYARYLVNKGMGVEWKGQYSNYGMLNPKKLSPSPTSLVADFIKANLQHIRKVSSIAPYSYLTQSFVPSDLIEVENIRKIGYFLKLGLSGNFLFITEFGKHEKSFQKLKERGGKVQLLVFCQFLQKLINPHCLCVTPNQKMIILKRHFLQKSPIKFSSQAGQQSTEVQGGIRFQYLITSLQIFNKHKEYFSTRKYEKHLIFESDHLVGMKARYRLQEEKFDYDLPIMGQIGGYERNPGVYVVNGSTSIPDYERVEQLKEKGEKVGEIRNVLESDGKVNLGQYMGNQGKSVENKKDTNNKLLSIIDIEFQEKLFAMMKQHLDFEELYDVFQDQVYSNKQTSQVLRFRLFDKFQIPIKEASYKILENYFSARSQDIVLHESKVKLPEFRKFNKPRERRQHRKLVKQSLKQRTQYMTLVESIYSISNIPISGSVEGDFKLWFEKDKEGNLVNLFDSKPDCREKGNNSFEEVTVSSDLMAAMSFLYNTEHSHDLNSIIIEPQTFTQQILPLSLHLTLFKAKQEPVKRGRKTGKEQTQRSYEKVLKSVKMIHLHPTMKPEQRDMQVDSFIKGSMKISSKEEYGFGFEAIRLWVCRHSGYLGDRQLKQREVNQQLKNSAFIRKLYAQLIPLVPSKEVSLELDQTPRNQLNFLDQFMLEQIDAYILNMEHFYSRLMLKQAYEYTMDFYQNLVQEIFVNTVRHHVITFPNHKDNLSHAVTIKRLLQLLSVIAPLFPFSAFHISKTDIIQWPQLAPNNHFYKNLLEYNALIKIRTELKNKLLINNFNHCQVVFPMSDTISYTQEDLKKFFGVDKISFVEPQVKEKKFSFQLRFNQSLGGKSKISVHESKDHCIRCDPHSKQKDHLCGTCSSYLQSQVGKQIQFYDRRNIGLLVQNQGASLEKQIKQRTI